MAEQLLHDLDIDAGLQGHGRRAVSQVVQADRRQASRLDQFVEHLGHLGGVQRAAVFVGEDAAGVDPGGTPGQALCDLSLAPGLKDRVGGFVELHHSFTGVALRGAGLNLPAELNELLGDSQGSRRPIAIDPAATTCLTAAKAAVRDEVIQRVQPVLEDEVEELAGLLGRPDHDRRWALGLVEPVELHDQPGDACGVAAFLRGLQVEFDASALSAVLLPGRDVLVGPHHRLRPFSRLKLHECGWVDGDEPLLLDGPVQCTAQGGPDPLLCCVADDSTPLHACALLRVARCAGCPDVFVVRIDGIEHCRDVHRAEAVDGHVAEVRTKVQANVCLVGPSRTLPDLPSTGEPFVEPLADGHRSVDYLSRPVASTRLVIVGQRRTVAECPLDRLDDLLASLVAGRSLFRHREQLLDLLTGVLRLGLRRVATALQHVPRTAVDHRDLNPEVPRAMPGIPSAVLAAQRWALRAEFAAVPVSTAAPLVRRAIHLA